MKDGLWGKGKGFLKREQQPLMAAYFLLMCSASARA